MALPDPNVEDHEVVEIHGLAEDMEHMTRWGYAIWDRNRAKLLPRMFHDEDEANRICRGLDGFTFP